MADPEIVSDDEVVYRSVRLNQANFGVDTDGRVRISSAAFGSDEEVSVFRHELCDSPPESNPPRCKEDDCVIALVVRKVRQIRLPIDGSKPQGACFEVGVQPDLTDNQHAAHAIVYPLLAAAGKSARLRLKKQLVEIVEKPYAIPAPPTFEAEIKALNAQRGS